MSEMVTAFKVAVYLTSIERKTILICFIISTEGNGNY